MCNLTMHQQEEHLLQSQEQTSHCTNSLDQAPTSSGHQYSWLLSQADFSWLVFSRDRGASTQYYWHVSLGLDLFTCLLFIFKAKKLSQRSTLNHSIYNFDLQGTHVPFMLIFLLLDSILQNLILKVLILSLYPLHSHTPMQIFFSLKLGWFSFSMHHYPSYANLYMRLVKIFGG